MASETRRAARALVERRTDRFESRHPLGESQARLKDTLSRARLEGRVIFTPEWKSEGDAAILEAHFAPPARVDRVLKTTSIAMTLLVAATIWALASDDSSPAVAWLTALTTAFAILALPFVYVAMGSSRLAEEGRIQRAIRAALLDEEERLPAAKKWEEE